MTIKNIFSIMGLFFVLVSGASAQDFVYRPVNPAFGGNYLNYQWLLSSAQVQSEFKEETPIRDSFTRDPLADFQSTISRQVLNQLSRQLMINYFGEGALGEGNYSFGNYEIEISPGIDGLVVHILDITTGGETTITIPHF